MSTTEVFDLFTSHAHAPYVIMVMIIIATFILEDVATSVAALLAASNTITVELALTSLIIGIIVGDLGLYAIGKLAQKSSWVLKQLQRKGGQVTQSILRKHVIGYTLLARFIPGMRLPVYTAMGLFSLSFAHFAATVVFAVGLWTSFLFFLFFKIGESAVNMVGTYQIISIASVILLAFLIPRLIKFSTNQIMKNK